MIRRRGFIAILAFCSLPFAPAATAQNAKPEMDAVLTAMTAEIERSKGLRLAALDDAYFVEYVVDDTDNLSITATLGSLVTISRTRMRVPRIQVRVGGYDFDHTNYSLSDYFTGRGRSIDRAPLDSDVIALQSHFWLATDSAYKGALTAFARKKAALKNVNSSEQIPDFSKAEPVVMVLAPSKRAVDETIWTERLRNISALFSQHPRITYSNVRMASIQSNAYLANSEGSIIRYPENLSYIEFRAEGQAPDGMLIRNARVVQRLDIEDMPGELDLQRVGETVADDLVSLLDAPVGDSYIGPVLLEGIAAPQLFAQLLGKNLALPRRPVPEPGRPVPFQPSEFEGRIGSHVLPEWMNAVDDPAQTQWRGQPLFGTYRIDIEGVVPHALTLVENGRLKNFLLTRQPVKGFSESNGRARLPGSYGANAAVFGNLFIQANETVTAEDLRRQLIEMCEQRNKEYGIVIRKLDFPSSTSMAELHRISSRTSQGGGLGNLVSAPLLAYKVYTDGREELVRALRFRSLKARVLRDIVAASDQEYLFSFLASNLPLSLMGANGFVTACSVVAPSILIDEVELDRDDSQNPKLPVVPPPHLITAP